jgi:hypothetical protein
MCCQGPDVNAVTHYCTAFRQHSGTAFQLRRVAFTKIHAQTPCSFVGAILLLLLLPAAQDCQLPLGQQQTTVLQHKQPRKPQSG